MGEQGRGIPFQAGRAFRSPYGGSEAPAAARSAASSRGSGRSLRCCRSACASRCPSAWSCGPRARRWRSGGAHAPRAGPSVTVSWRLRFPGAIGHGTQSVCCFPPRSAGLGSTPRAGGSARGSRTGESAPEKVRQEPPGQVVPEDQSKVLDDDALGEIGALSSTHSRRPFRNMWGAQAQSLDYGRSDRAAVQQAHSEEDVSIICYLRCSHYCVRPARRGVPGTRTPSRS